MRDIARRLVRRVMKEEGPPGVSGPSPRLAAPADQAAANAVRTARKPRHPANPKKAKPKSAIAQVEGSGTTVEKGDERFPRPKPYEKPNPAPGWLAASK
jgi:hypothetical protein